jgi:hypothetical protein
VTAVLLAATTTTLVSAGTSGDSNTGLVVATFFLVVVTTIAAVATAFMARRTRAAATATARAADAAEKSLKAATAPLLTFDPAESTRNDQDNFQGLMLQVGYMGGPSAWIAKSGDSAIVLAVRIRNIGPGPAQIGTADADVELRHEHLDINMSGGALARVIAPHESTIVYFAEALPTKSLLMDLVNSVNIQTIEVRVRYSDVARTRWLRSTLRLRLDARESVQVDKGQRLYLGFVELVFEEEDGGD